MLASGAGPWPIRLRRHRYPASYLPFGFPSAGSLAEARLSNSQKTGHSGGRHQMVKLRVNGQDRTFDGDPSMPLLWYLRDELGLTGTKFGCGIAQCGACTVHVNGAAARACITAMSDAADAEVVTIEGLDPKGNHPVQKAWRALGVPQCGYCQSGQIMQAVALLKDAPNPTDQDIDSTMSGNICRCGTYPRIRAAIKQAAGQGA
jgi:isoquinoline 1-oxidoreductase alpha subunit